MGSFFLRVLFEEVVFPALAGAGDEEPVVVEPDLVAANLVVAVALLGRGRGPLLVAPVHP